MGPSMKERKMNSCNENDIRAISIANLDKYAKNFKILIDTCSLIGNGDGREDLFLDNIIPLLRKNGNKIIVPTMVVKELEKIKANPKREGLDELASKAYRRLVRLQSQDCLSINGEQTDTYADHVFQHVIAKFRVSYNIILVSNDKKLISYFERMNMDQSVRANEVKCMGINKYGFLSPKTGNASVNSVSNSHNGSVSRFSSKSTAAFSMKSVSVSTLTNIKDEVMKVTSIPSENDVVTTGNGRKIRLGGSISEGGEGVIFSVDGNSVAKIYKRENNTRRKYEKIKLMVSKKLNFTGICFPSELLFNQYNQFVGFLMPKAKGKVIRNCVFGKPHLMNNFPNWKKRDTVELSLTILEKIRYLHNHGIIIGDINPDNIMVVSTKEVYFVDTDSYQVDGFPCPVGTVNFTAPEIQKKHFPDFLRTIGNENFAVATLLFMIMLPGKAPYAHQGGTDQVSNIEDGEFSYPLGECSNKKAPDGAWRYIWSHMTYRAKEAFYETFHKGGKYYSEKDRLSVYNWIHIFREYLDLLDSGKLAERDPQSAKLFPTRFKMVDKTRNGSVSASSSTSYGSVQRRPAPAPSAAPASTKQDHGIFSFLRSLF